MFNSSSVTCLPAKCCSSEITTIKIIPTQSDCLVQRSHVLGVNRFLHNINEI
jgi:hypothetical protein